MATAKKSDDEPEVDPETGTVKGEGDGVPPGPPEGEEPPGMEPPLMEQGRGVRPDRPGTTPPIG